MPTPTMTLRLPQIVADLLPDRGRTVYVRTAVIDKLVREGELTQADADAAVEQIGKHSTPA